ncbi:hypothetical protein [Archangium sp.]|uniref:hypothetical protein n=1 Tax=Archangium sp. TaxID=1872627 RepID=UPI00286BF436|nr:hypothetical protein [Archangium sp.]
MHADILLRTPDGEPIAVIEAKGAMRLTPEIAVDIRRRLLTHGLPAHIPYFLLLSQERGYLWQDSSQLRSDTPPTAEFAMSEVVTRYLPAASGARLHGVQLELLLMQWLTELVAGVPRSPGEPEGTLSKTGFLEAIRDAQVLHEASLGPAGVLA